MTNIPHREAHMAGANLQREVGHEYSIRPASDLIHPKVSMADHEYLHHDNAIRELVGRGQMALVAMAHLQLGSKTTSSRDPSPGRKRVPG